MTVKKNGMMFVLSSPSGAGKTTLTKKLAENNFNFKISISCTTREPRPNEVNGKDYHFIDKAKFDLLIKDENFFEYAKIFDNYYGTLKKPVMEILQSGKDVLFDIDWQGTQQLKKIDGLKIFTIFIIPPDINTLQDRLLKRHQGKKELVEERMKKFKEEISHWDEYDWVMVNDNLETCYSDLKEIISSKKKGMLNKQDHKIIAEKINILTK